MCLQTSSIRPFQKWNWNGSEIVYDTAIPASRKLVKGKETIHKFPIDIREFISIENNAVIKNFIKKQIVKLEGEEQIRFYKSGEGNFDFRVSKCQEFINTITYKKANANSKFDEWQFPDETLELQTGDCEDLAFLLASFILQCGISDYCVRVALGNVINHAASKAQSWEHAWVMYQNENGVWEIIEPLLFTKHTVAKSSGKSLKGKPEKLDIEYLPHYVFNRHHLWKVRTNDNVIRKTFNDYLKTERSYFNKFNPGFAASVHNSIYNEALKGMPWFDRQKVILTSLYIDVNTTIYDPRDHFDFAYIDDSWKRINDRLATKKLKDFALAIHAIGDFYAHTSYAYFAYNPQTKSLPIYDSSKPLDPQKIKYDFSTLGDMPDCKLSTCSPGTQKPEALWDGKIISGRWFRWFAPVPNEIQNRADFCTRKCLPDHDTIAVDSTNFNQAKHKYCTSKPEYDEQFRVRKLATIEHIKMVYTDWKK
jgi:hypothetical protein